MTRTLALDEARRIAVRAQLLDARDPGDLVDVVRALTMLPLNPTDIVCPTAEHVAHTRVRGLAADDVRRAVEVDQTLVEHLGPHAHPIEAWAIGLRAASDRPWLTAIGLDPHAIHVASSDWLDANEGFRGRVLDQLRDEGPLPQRDIADTADVPYRSSGWNTGRDVAMMLELLQIRGDVVVAERVGQARVWARTEQVLGAVEPVPLAHAWDEWRRRWLRAMGVARPRHFGDVGEDVRIEGLPGMWRLDTGADGASVDGASVDGARLDGASVDGPSADGVGATAEGFVGRVVVLCPIDRLIADRKRMRELFGFDYALEQYTPAAKRRWGPYALPILAGDRLVGKVDARAERDRGVLAVRALHWDVDPDDRLRDAVRDELDALADFVDLRLAMP